MAARSGDGPNIFQMLLVTDCYCSLCLGCDHFEICEAAFVHARCHIVTRLTVSKHCLIFRSSRCRIPRYMCFFIPRACMLHIISDAEL